jgi:hypothetical protein
MFLNAKCVSISTGSLHIVPDPRGSTISACPRNLRHRFAREEAIRLHVAAFHASLPKLSLNAKAEETTPPPTAVLFEEVKAMFRIVSDQISELGRRAPLERRRLEENDESIPAWVEEANELINELDVAEEMERRLAFWKRISTIASVRIEAPPRCLRTIREALRTRDTTALRTGLAELRQYLSDAGRIMPKDDNDMYAYLILRRLADIVERWVVVPGQSAVTEL